MESIISLSKKLREKIFEDQERLLRCQLEVDALLRLRNETSTQRIMELKEEISGLEELVDQSTNRLRQCLEVCRTVTENCENTNNISEKTISSQIPTNLPVFKVSNDYDCIDVDDFVMAFEIKLSAAGVPKNLWSKILISTVPSYDQATTVWLSENIINLPWDDASVLIKNHYRSSDSEFKYVSAFNQIKLGRSELLPHFCDRFAMLAKKGRSLS